MKAYTFRAPAKVNLALRVVGRADNGYHLLKTVMTFFPWFDELTIEPTSAPEIELTCHPVNPAPKEQNLVYRAAIDLQQAGGYGGGARMHLLKRIPAGAGLGGGSSDAATALLGLNRLWGLDLPLEKLLQIGVSLGADVPIFLGGVAALAEGIGEKLSPLPELTSADLVVIHPGVHLSTQAVFQSHSGQLTNPSLPLNMPKLEDGWEGLGGLLNNDLEPAAKKLAPVIDEAIGSLIDAGARFTLMSGSGSSVFGVFPDPQAARQAAGQLGSSHPGWQVVAGRTLNSHPFESEWMAI
ncbi:MAG: 4-(cytidine 5'-diphospho)-2-C-methyl-D-erythritol kinase [Magnetococcales bacterium]|nr:4-(cytidine 5'-diphospho)-2-C-methyl-D-erythritol kinase [Magnetococcales bacterium]